jgi:hypothetical protein
MVLGLNDIKAANDEAYIRHKLPSIDVSMKMFCEDGVGYTKLLYKPTGEFVIGLFGGEYIKPLWRELFIKVFGKDDLQILSR